MNKKFRASPNPNKSGDKLKKKIKIRTEVTIAEFYTIIGSSIVKS